jgi:uncharacterized repeat protein (TIGR02543 family)
LFNKARSELLVYPADKDNASYSIPLAVTDIGHYAFVSSQKLTSVEIHNGVRSIGDNAFANCRSLASVSLGGGVESIGNAAFSACMSLGAVVIPKSVATVGLRVFVGAKGPLYCVAASAPAGWDDAWAENYTGQVVWGYAPPAQKVVVTFDANGGSAATSRTVDVGSELGALPKSKRAGYTLLGWYTAKKDGSAVSASTVVKAAVTYYAHWKADPYKVKFVSAGKVVKTYSRAGGAKLGKLPVPKRKGYKFKGWYTKKKGGSAVSASRKVKGAASYYARWARTGKIVGASVVKLRKGASNSSRLTGYAFKGRTVEYLAKKGSWYKVRQGSKVGYLPKKYLRLDRTK